MLKHLNAGVQATEADVWAEYVEGGLGWWLWFLPRLLSICPPAAAQYFHNQVLAFVVDHGVTLDSVPMMRA